MQDCCISIANAIGDTTVLHQAIEMNFKVRDSQQISQKLCKIC